MFYAVPYGSKIKIKITSLPPNMYFYFWNAVPYGLKIKIHITLNEWEICGNIFPQISNRNLQCRFSADFLFELNKTHSYPLPLIFEKYFLFVLPWPRSQQSTSSGCSWPVARSPPTNLHQQRADGYCCKTACLHPAERVPSCSPPPTRRCPR